MCTKGFAQHASVGLTPGEERRRCHLGDERAKLLSKIRRRRALRSRELEDSLGQVRRRGLCGPELVSAYLKRSRTLIAANTWLDTNWAATACALIWLLGPPLTTSAGLRMRFSS